VRIEVYPNLASCVMSILILSTLYAQDMKKGCSDFHGSYLGQELPGCKPEPFVPELFSVWSDYGFHLITSIYFSPDNKELFFTNQSLPVVEGRGCSIWYMQQRDGFWTEPRKVSFSSNYSDRLTFFSSDGRKLYFASTRPISGQGPPKDYDIWFVKRSGEGWSEPARLGFPINCPYNDLGGVITSNGSIYFSSDRPGSMSSYDIYVARPDNGGYTESNLGEVTNSEADEYIVHVAPDESYLIFYRNDLHDKINSGLFIIYRKADGRNWTKSKSMGDHINILDASNASISPDGRYLFLLSRGYGVCWLKTDIIEYLKTENLAISDILLDAALHKDIGAAVALYHELKQEHAAYIDIDEYLLNQRGHDFLEAAQLVKAVTLFKINVALFPDSWNAYDSLGEAYLSSGHAKLAIQCYERSLELNPRNEHAIKELEHIRTVFNH
jgi:hypothetical protein